MKIDPVNKSFTLTMDEVITIVNERLKHAHMDNTNDNPLISSFNNGADIMADYIKDYFAYELAKEFAKQGGNI